ncbi:MAG: TM2 domain-containing protein [Clostridia bacterium]|nr:TM2 domain-containing protein [Clostridia bacterium]
MAKNYSVDDQKIPQQTKSYSVQDDREIRGAGFSNKASEERRLIEERDKYSEKSPIVCLILSLIHCHYFYVGRIGRGLLCLFTANFLYIGWVIDLILILGGKFKDKNNKPLSPSRRAAEMALEQYYADKARQ